MADKTFYVFHHSSSNPNHSNVPGRPNYYVSESSEAFRDLPLESINWNQSVSAENADQAVNRACYANQQVRRSFRP